LAGNSAPTAASVTVAAPARLHLGFLDPSGGLGRRFASIGLAIAELGTRISLRTAASARIEGPEHARAARHLEIMQRHLRLRALDIRACTGLNRGAQIDVHSALDSRSG
jgi:beta-ribofuranosylaminobenzene 5'-phosphate synthase